MYGINDKWHETPIPQNVCSI